MMCTASMPAWSAETGITDKEILIGQTISLRGGKDPYGVASLGGIKLFLDGANAAGGVNGRRIVLRTLDDEGKAPVADANARKLVQEGSFILFGSLEGGPSTAAAKVAAESSVPLFGPMAGPPTLRRPHQPMVFPVRAEHRDEFRALMNWGKSIGLTTVGLLHADTPVGQEHFKNVNLIAQELGMKAQLGLPFKPDVTDAQVDDYVSRIESSGVQLLLNHGSAALYERLIKAARKRGLRTVFMGVNSGSFQIARALGDKVSGMVFAQVVPSPWERKLAIAREYQDAARRADPKAELSYGALEGYLTAKALVLALKAAGRDLTRESFVKTLQTGSFDLGGITLRYRAGDHEGSRFVDLSMVSRDGQFIH